MPEPLRLIVPYSSLERLSLLLQSSGWTGDMNFENLKGFDENDVGVIQAAGLRDALRVEHEENLALVTLTPASGQQASGSQIPDYDLIIFDVNGTLVTTQSGQEFPENAADWRLLPGRLEILAALRWSGVKIALASNQGGVAFGYYPPEDMRRELRKIGEAAGADMVNWCFRHPQGKVEPWIGDCHDRKPSHGMLEKAITHFQTPRDKVLMVGDRPEDEQAAANAGVAFAWAKTYFGDPG